MLATVVNGITNLQLGDSLKLFLVNWRLGVRVVIF